MQLDQTVNLMKLSWPKTGYRLTWGPWRETRSLSQNALQHVIYDDISTYLISKGRTEWSPEFTKEMCKYTLLPIQKREFTNIKTGKKEIREELTKTSTLDVGESYKYTTDLLEFAERIGCVIAIPENCEYRDLRENQVE